MPPSGSKRNYAQMAGTAARYGLKYGPKILRLARNISSRKVGGNNRIRYRGGGSSVITRQEDVKSSKSKGISKRKRKEFKFAQKVQKAINYHEELLSFVETPTAAYVIPSAILGAQYQQVYTSYATSNTTDLRLGFYHTSTRGFRRFLNDVSNAYVTTTFLSGPQKPQPEGLKAHIKSQTMTLAIKNITDRGNGAYNPAITPNPISVFVDIYECVARCDILDAEYQSASRAWFSANSNFNTTAGQLPANTKNEINFSGFTPYNTRGFGKYWKILKKTRVLIGEKQKINLTINGYKGPVDIGKDEMLATKGKTKDVIIIANPTFNDMLTDQLAIEVQWTKTTNCVIKDMPGFQASVSVNYQY